MQTIGRFRRVLNQTAGMAGRQALRESRTPGNRLRFVGDASPQRPGWTLLELMLVTGIISLVLAVALPAMGRLREASRMTACRNNLRQIILAVAQYETAHGVYPAGRLSIEHDSHGAVRGSHFSGHSRILPQLGEAALFAKIDFRLELPSNGTWGGESSLLALCDAAPLAALRCPSDSGARRAAASYAFNMGSRPACLAEFNGPFLDRFLRSVDMSDGLSQTVGVSEMLVSLSDAPYDPRRHIAWLSTPRDLPSHTHPMLGDEWISTCATLNAAPLLPNRPEDAYTIMGRWWIDGDGTLYNHILPPNSSIPSCARVIRLPPNGITTSRSEHSGIVLSAMMDGSVRAFSDRIDFRIWQGLGGRNDGMAIDDFF